MLEDDETNEIGIADTGTPLIFHSNYTNSIQCTILNLANQRCNLLGYNNIGDHLYICKCCGAYMWYQEWKKKNYYTNTPKCYLCCGDGKIQLPLLRRPPVVLHRLLYDKDSIDSKNFQKHIWLYIMMFAFTSPGTNLDTTLNNGSGPSVIKI